MKKNKLPVSRSIPFSMKTGFSLVEVLVVIAIISILMTAGAIGLGNLTAGKGTTSAVATCESLFEEARTIAISKRCSARVLVDVNSNTTQTYLRRVVIAHQKINADGTVDASTWIVASRGYTMPTGTFFSREYSKVAAGTKIAETSVGLKNEAGTNLTEYSGKKYATYEFNSEGIIANPGASFVIGAGIRPKNGEPRATSSAERDFAGFVIWRNGRTSTYRSPDQIPSLPAKVTTF